MVKKRSAELGGVGEENLVGIAAVRFKHNNFVHTDLQHGRRAVKRLLRSGVVIIPPEVKAVDGDEAVVEAVEADEGILRLCVQRQCAAQESGFTINTGITGYEICNAILIQEDGYGGVINTPIPTEYDEGTGNLALQGTFQEGQIIDIDFYTDGVFDRDLGYDVKRILGLCVQLVWESRFVNAFLIQQPKIKDRSFDVGNEANHMRASTERLRAMTARLNGELNAFEQDLEYGRVVLHNEPDVSN